MSSMVTDNHHRHEEFRLRLLPLGGTHFRSTISLPLHHSFLVRRAMEVAANMAQILTLPTLGEMLVCKQLLHGRYLHWDDAVLSIPVCSNGVSVCT